MLYDPKRNWLHRASCRTVDPARFFSETTTQFRDSPPKATQQAWDAAKRICSLCPVLTQCQRDTLGEEYGVWGGRDEHQRHLIRKRLSQGAWRRWSEERQLEWGAHLAELREQGHTQNEIRLATGLLPTACDGLIEKWRSHVAAQDVEHAVGTVNPTQGGERMPPPAWPVRPGERHAWVRNNGLIADAWYAGETPDGEWVRVQHFSGRGNVIKWVKREDVQFYNPQTPYHLEYAGREQRERPAA